MRAASPSFLLGTLMNAAGVVCVVALTVGCASHRTDERLDLLEARVDSQQVYDLRIGSLEERVAALEGDVGAMRVDTPPVKKSGKTAPRVVKQSNVPSVTIEEAPSMRPPVALHPGMQGPSSSLGPTSGQTAIDQTLAELRASQETPAVAGEGRIKTVAAPGKDAAGSSGDKAAYASALNLYEQKKYGEAEKRFAAFLERYPSSKLAPNAMYWYGECFYSRKEYATAIVNFKNVAARFPKHDKAAAALYKVGLSYQQLKDTENARFYWNILKDDFPGSAPARLADKQLKTA